MDVLKNIELEMYCKKEVNFMDDNELAKSLLS